jgi:hypothetical protein
VRKFQNYPQGKKHTDKHRWLEGIVLVSIRADVGHSNASQVAQEVLRRIQSDGMCTMMQLGTWGWMGGGTHEVEIVSAELIRVGGGKREVL